MRSLIEVKVLSLFVLPALTLGTDSASDLSLRLLEALFPDGTCSQCQHSGPSHTRLPSRVGVAFRCEICRAAGLERDCHAGAHLRGGRR